MSKENHGKEKGGREEKGREKNYLRRRRWLLRGKSLNKLFFVYSTQFKK